MSADCPRIAGQTYAEWIAAKLNNEIFVDTIWDGHFLDNGGGNIWWVNDWSNNTATGGIDADRDGQPDEPGELDDSWYQGLETYYQTIRQAQGQEFVIIANKGSLDFKDLVDGKLFENFPNDYLGSEVDGGWPQCIYLAKQLGPYTIFHASRENLDFVLASALLLDNVYVAIGQDDPRLFRKFYIQTGQAKSKLKVAKLKSGANKYYRRFENGQIEVYPQKRKGLIKL